MRLFAKGEGILESILLPPITLGGGDGGDGDGGSIR